MPTSGKHLRPYLFPTALAGFLLACGSPATDSPGAQQGCDPGQVFTCACVNGVPGSQVCDADGASLSPCACDASGFGGAGGTGDLPPASGGSSGGVAPTGGAPSGGVTSSGGAPTGGVTASGGDSSGGVESSGGGTGAGGSAAGSGGEGGIPNPTAMPEGIPSDASCTGMTLPATADYGAPGPFTTLRIDGTGPDGQYTMFRPEFLGGSNGFLHPPMTWGNGIYTTPDAYVGLLTTLASHGFVIIGSNSTNVNSVLMTAGLDWLLAQNTTASDFQGKLATDCAVSIGYSLGGGAAVDTGRHANVVTTVSFHGLQGTAEQLHGPLFLLTSTNDGFVTKSGFVQPTYNRSSVVPTLMATLEVPGAIPDNYGHIIPLNDAGDERAPAVAWVRHWVYGDEGARHYFFGNDCVLCQTPWVDIQRKNGDWQ